MRFHDYFSGLTGSAKKDLAARAETSVIYLYHLSSGKKRPSLEMAEKLQRASGDVVRLQDWETLPPTEQQEARAPQ
jgi:hypothetical protein